MNEEIEAIKEELAQLQGAAYFAHALLTGVLGAATQDPHLLQTLNASVNLVRDTLIHEPYSKADALLQHFDSVGAAMFGGLGLPYPPE